MKNVLKGILIALGIIMLVGMVGCVGSMFLVGTAVNETVEEVTENNDTYNDLVQLIEWEYTTDEFGYTTITGLLTNTTDKEIDYIDIEYKLIKDGVTVESSFTNASNIEPNETVKVEIYTVEEFDTIKVKGSGILE